MPSSFSSHSVCVLHFRSGGLDSIYGSTRNPWKYNFKHSKRGMRLQHSTHNTDNDVINRSIAADSTGSGEVGNDDEEEEDWYISGGSSGGSAVAVATGTCFG